MARRTSPKTHRCSIRLSHWMIWFESVQVRSTRSRQELRAESQADGCSIRIPSVVSTTAPATAEVPSQLSGQRHRRHPGGVGHHARIDLRGHRRGDRHLEQALRRLIGSHDARLRDGGLSRVASVSAADCGGHFLVQAESACVDADRRLRGTRCASVRNRTGRSDGLPAPTSAHCADRRGARQLAIQANGGRDFERHLAGADPAATRADSG